jgi:geranylgeranyl diphosphate synthase, type II
LKSRSDKCEIIFKNEISVIDKKLKKLFVGKKPLSLYEPCSYFLKGSGKRLRPFLVIASAKAVNGNIKDVYNAAVAVELLHNFTLVHDDIMDNSSKRRGLATLHTKYDLSTAILAGDSLIVLAYQNLLKDSKVNVNKIVLTFTNAILEICEGQSLDKEFETRNNVSIDEYKKMIYKKTAALLEMCCSVGAQLCGASEKYIRAVSNYGKYLGMAFQIQDDLLDIVGKENEFGKKIGNDLIEGKKTFLFLRAFEKAKTKDKLELIRVIKNNGIKPDEVDKYKELYFKLGVIQDAEHEIMKYTKLALKNLTGLPNNDGKDMMMWLAKILINRKK